MCVCVCEKEGEERGGWGRWQLGFVWGGVFLPPILKAISGAYGNGADAFVLLRNGLLCRLSFVLLPPFILRLDLD